MEFKESLRRARLGHCVPLLFRAVKVRKVIQVLIAPTREGVREEEGQEMTIAYLEST